MPPIIDAHSIKRSQSHPNVSQLPGSPAQRRQNRATDARVRGKKAAESTTPTKSKPEGSVDAENEKYQSKYCGSGEYRAPTQSSSIAPSGVEGKLCGFINIVLGVYLCSPCEAVRYDKKK